MARPTVLVTGAAGFVGGWVTEALCARDMDVRAGVRSAARSSRLPELPVALVQCDVGDARSLREAMRGAQVVINCVRDDASSDLTVEGTRKIISAAIANGVKRLIQMSSVAVYGNAVGIIDEDTPPVRSANRYATDKRAAEELCRAAAGADLTITVVRPSLVYGPSGEEWSARFIRGILSGDLQQLGAAGEGQANLLYARDLGEFTAHIALADLPNYAVYNANGAEIPTFNAYFDRLSRALGRGPLPPSAPPAPGAGARRQARRIGRFMLRRHGEKLRHLAEASAGLTSVLNRIEAGLRPGVHDGPADSYARHVIFSIDRARQIGFVPRTPLQEGIDASVRWARSLGLAPS
ncbi:MAG TPA: NAD-dependent epimerase/dehydratase family protein [Bradyrhizobium sp.]|nr:NAD-dependent epimerase/dehydratase family protein [Bradyrhizobium sp.]